MKTRSSLPSLLALAAGASALPIAAEASIIYTDLGTQTVGFGGGQSASVLINLPNFGAQLEQLAIGRFTGVGTHRISAKKGGDGYMAVRRASGTLPFAFRGNTGATWSSQGIPSSPTSAFIIATDGAAILGPGEFSSTKYLLFWFNANPEPNYGWVGMSAATATPGVPANMSVTLTGWAYDDSGAKIAAGAIPEPATNASLAMGGALVLGAAGLRQWRKRKVTTAKSVSDLIAS
ncbi:MAG: hypothetical protein WCS65_03480 [Verrucomicrobiae bacterium]